MCVCLIFLCFFFYYYYYFFFFALFCFVAIFDLVRDVEATLSPSICANR